MGCERCSNGTCDRGDQCFYTRVALDDLIAQTKKIASRIVFSREAHMGIYLDADELQLLTAAMVEVNKMEDEQ